MDRITQELVRFARARSERALDGEQRLSLKLRILDAVGCGIAVVSHAPIERLCAAVLGLGEGGPCRVIGRGHAAVDRATLLNGFMIRYLDLNDTYLSKEGLHPSDLVAGALAVGEAAHRSGEEVLRALGAAYHVICDLSDLVSLRDRGWDHVNFGSIAAAVSAGMLLRLSDEQMANAISLAIVPHAALRQTRVGKLSVWKGIAFPNAAAGAVLAAYLAAGGIEGPDEPFEGKYGFANQVSGPLALALDPARDRTRDTYIKLFPVAHHGQGIVELSLDLRAKLKPDGADAKEMLQAVREAEVRTYRDTIAVMADAPEKWAPATRETADHSVPFLAALALVRGRVDQAEIEGGIHDPDVLAMAERIRVVEDPSFSRRFPAELPVGIRLAGPGGELSGELTAPLGHVTRPAGRERIVEKFHANADRVVGRERAAAFARAALDLEKLADVAGILGEIGTPS